jgi:cysteine desulfurase family protein (TIGR01976 family)
MSSTTPVQTVLDIDWVREQFPAFARRVNGHAAAFLDGPGGTQVPHSVIDAISEYLVRCNANTHGQYVTSRESDEVIAEAHQAMADLLNCDADEVAFGPNMTTLTLSLSRAIGRTLKPGDEIVVTTLDHSANVSPWMALEERGVTIRKVDVNPDDCTLNLDDFKVKLNERTRVVAVGYASNAVGTINPVAEITRLAHDVGALVFIDSVHYAPHGLIDSRAIDCDFLACSPYKFFGPHSACSMANAKSSKL